MYSYFLYNKDMEQQVRVCSQFTMIQIYQLNLNFSINKEMSSHFRKQKE